MSCRAILSWFFGVVFCCLTGPCLAGEVRVLHGEPSPGTKNWMPGDVLVTGGVLNEVKPSITSAPNGDLYMAVEELDSGYIRLYRSTDDGHTWGWVFAFASGDDTRNPSVAYGEHSNGEKWVYVAYEQVTTADDTRLVRVIRYNPITVAWDSQTIDGPFIMSGAADQVHPQIITDHVDWGDDYYPYVTYAKFAIDYYPVFCSRSTDRGVAWSTPLNVTGGSENTSWPARPEIAYGFSGLFITFVKPGWTGSSWSNQIWVTESSDYGFSFTTPFQLTTTSNNVFHPVVAAAHGVGTLVVAFTMDFGADTDVTFTSSTDGGTTWGSVDILPWTFDYESSVDLAVSNSGGYFHAAYKHDDMAVDEIWYSSATVAAPTVWSSAVVVNEGNTASAGFPRPTIAVNPAMSSDEEAAIAWTDWRQPYPPYDVYFDSAGLAFFADGFESGDVTAWSTSVP